MWYKILLILFALGLGPLSAVCFSSVRLGQDWRTAPRHSTGIAPDAGQERRAVVQVYAARAFNWRGAFAVHTWVVTKAARAPEFQIHEVIGWRRHRGLPVVVSRLDLPDRSWFGNDPDLLLDIRGERAVKLIPRIEKAAASYPYPDRYTVWPGPNSNTFVAWIGRQVPELKMVLPNTAIGKDYPVNGHWLDQTPSGTGYQFSLLGVFGLLVARSEGVEINILGLSFGIDPFTPALKIPGIGRIPQG